MTDLVLGIDTCGTYTDGVLLDFQTREVLMATKTITTHHDLKRCILRALDAILPDDPGSVRLVSISTTLATNAIVEGKGRPVALFILGYDPELIQRCSLASNFGTTHFEYLQGGHTFTGEEIAPLDLEMLEEFVKRYESEVEAYAISGYFSPFNPEHELPSEGTISDLVEAPVVLGHQLSSRLNSVQRAATASLKCLFTFHSAELHPLYTRCAASMRHRCAADDYAWRWRIDERGDCQPADRRQQHPCHPTAPIKRKLASITH